MSNIENVAEIFSLTLNQARIMFSIEYALTKHDIENTKNENKKRKKEEWLLLWSNSIVDTLQKLQTGQHSDSTELAIYESVPLYDISQLKSEITKELNQNSKNKTWYYLSIMEAALFTAYTPLSEKKEKNNLTFSNQTDFLKYMVYEHGIIKSDYVDRVKKAYMDSIKSIKGISKSAVFATTLVSLASIGIGALIAGGSSAAIAVALFGSNFPTLSGAALTSASLAFVGGGAISAGGMGMAGGTAIITGGGALLGGILGTTVSGTVTHTIASVPEFALLQAAKLETAVKEVVLNTQKDIECAKEIMNQISEAIIEHTKQILSINNPKDKEKAKLNKSLGYLQKMYKRLQRFESSFEIGLSKESEKK